MFDSPVAIALEALLVVGTTVFVWILVVKRNKKQAAAAEAREAKFYKVLAGKTFIVKARTKDGKNTTFEASLTDFFIRHGARVIALGDAKAKAIRLDDFSVIPEGICLVYAVVWHTSDMWGSPMLCADYRMFDRTSTILAAGTTSSSSIGCSSRETAVAAAVADSVVARIAA